eukprot:scaffold4236_cov122-Skeletonema_marinoi.AAC.4
MDDTDQTYGLQNYICCRCMKIYCYLCRAVDMNIGSMLETCDQCERNAPALTATIKFVPTAWRWRSVTNAKNAGVVIALQCSLDALFVPKDYAVIVPEKKVCPRPILNQNKWLKQENDRLKTEIRRLKDENRRLLASQGM